MRITEQTAIVLREILKAPKGRHDVPTLCATLGMPRPTTQGIMRKLENENWLSSTRDTFRLTSVPPKRFYRFTAAGRKLAAAELKDWHFDD